MAVRICTCAKWAKLSSLPSCQLQFKLYSVVVQPLLLINGQCQEFFNPFLSYKKNGLGPYEDSTTNSREYLRKLCVALVSLNRAKEECFD